jgi:glycosyltransferase involved in cell wall biosynthesis
MRFLKKALKKLFGNLFNPHKSGFIDSIDGRAVTDLNGVLEIKAQMSVTLGGWAIDSESGNLADEVYICIGENQCRAVYGHRRPDVARHFRNPGILNSGFTCKAPVHLFKDGENEIILKTITGKRKRASIRKTAFRITARFLYGSSCLQRDCFKSSSDSDDAEMLLSIIIPCFNDGRFLPDALASISEIKDINCEVIIIDDGSDDSETLEYLGTLDGNRYRLIRQQKQGVSSARNAGIRTAGGKYILPLDADNKIMPEYAYMGIRFLEDNPEFAIVYSDQQRFGLCDETARQSEFDIFNLIPDNCVDTCAIYRREVWEQCGGYDENMMGFEDWELWMRAYEYGFRFYHLPEPLYFYRVKGSEESLNLTCQKPVNFTKLLSHIYSRHSLLVRHTLRRLNERNRELERKLNEKDILTDGHKLPYPCIRKRSRDDEEGGRIGILDELAADIAGYQSTDGRVNPRRVSVIICTYNRWNYLQELMKALTMQSYPHFEVIIVNGPSTDDTCRVRELYPNVKYTEIKQTNISIARNAGIRLAHGDYLVFVDDDALPCDSEWISRFVRAFSSDRRIAAVAAPVISGSTGNYEFYRAFGSYYGKLLYIWPSNDIETWDSYPANEQFPFDTGQGSNIAVRRKELLETGGFDEYYRYYLDEADVFCRLFVKGHATFNLKDNVQRHFRGPSEIRGNGFDLKWATLASSLAYYGMKNGNDRFPVRVMKVACALLSEKSREIISHYRNNDISLAKTLKYLMQYCSGGIKGMLAGTFRKRRLLSADHPTVESRYVNFSNAEKCESKYRIAVVAPRMASGESGGAERFHNALTESLNTEKASAELIQVLFDDSSFEAIEESYFRCHNLDLSEYDAVISTKAPTYQVRHRNHICYLQHTIRSYYDMYEGQITNSESDRQRNAVIRADNQALKPPGVKKIFSQGHEIRDRLLKWNGLESEVMHPGPVMKCARPRRYEYIFMPGRLHIWKRVELVIKAMRYLRHPVRLRIAGTGEDAERLQLMAVSDERVEFLGYVSDEEMASLYADALVVPFVPVREDYGYITLEAFGHEKPVITCRDSGEPLQFVKDGINGFVVEPRPKEIARALEYFIEDPDRARTMGQRGRESIEHINWPDISRKIISVLQQ